MKICSSCCGSQVPVFTLFKRCPSAALPPSPPEGTRQCVDQEILLPNFSHTWDKLHFFPWEEKMNSALMRGSLQVMMPR